ncbi:MAG TPA: O-acetyl-ADP-ribose deacetylase [Xanthomonadales bacterium]|nr:O-acetyl-ADP-ribose deacetylase [Xanthomonadales bacterium]
MAIETIRDDITTLALDAIVNAANETLLGGGGVDGAIHRAAGPALLAECAALPQLRPGVRCPTGEARITRGHGLAARYVIHTVGPVWHGGGRGEAKLLASCYRSVFALVGERGLRSVALPAISCGIYGYPIDEACAIAVREARAFLAAVPATRIVFCAFGDEVADAYRRALS